MRETRPVSQAFAVLPTKAIVFFLLLGILSALIMVKPLSASTSMQNQSCFGTQEAWENLRRDTRRKLRESRRAETDLLLGTRGIAKGRGRIPTYSYPGADAGGSDHPPGSYGDLQYRAGSWTNPHRPGASSRLDYERQLRELRDLDGYIRRCFTDAEPEDNAQTGVEKPCRPMLSPLFFGKCDEPTHKGRDCYYGPDD